MFDSLFNITAVIRQQLQKHHNSTVNCLLFFCGLAENEARQMVEDSRLFSVSDYSTDPKIPLLLGEDPYFLAMTIFYAPTNPTWFADPDLWPPPDEVVKLYDR